VEGIKKKNVEAEGWTQDLDLYEEKMTLESNGQRFFISFSHFNFFRILFVGLKF